MQRQRWLSGRRRTRGSAQMGTVTPRALEQRITAELLKYRGRNL
jgi:hypothetical protein